jgi:hypothetical protein
MHQRSGGSNAARKRAVQAAVTRCCLEHDGIECRLCDSMLLCWVLPVAALTKMMRMIFLVDLHIGRRYLRGWLGEATSDHVARHHPLVSA